MSVPLTLLGLLEREPSHGYDLKRDYDAYFGRDKPLPYGQVYATLSRLARDGMAVAGPPEPGDGPERKRYAITGDGVTEVNTWLETPSAPEQHRLQDRPADRYLDLQRGAHLQRMRELTELKQHGSMVDTLLADHGLYHLEADLRWIDHTAARLSALAREVRR